MGQNNTVHLELVNPLVGLTDQNFRVKRLSYVRVLQVGRLFVTVRLWSM